MNAKPQVAKVVARLSDLGCAEIALSDTIGRATPERVSEVVKAALNEAPASLFGGHFHDTGGLALANVDAAWELGLRVFDSAVGGLGGCPYAPGAASHGGRAEITVTTGEPPVVNDPAMVQIIGDVAAAMVGPCGRHEPAGLDSSRRFRLLQRKATIGLFSARHSQRGGRQRVSVASPPVPRRRKRHGARDGGTGASGHKVYQSIDRLIAVEG
jgi:HMGL-like